MSEESTTPDLVERWQETAGAYARRDFHTMMCFFAPDVVWDASSAGLEIFEGAQAVRSFVEDWIGAYEEYEYAQEEGRELGNGVQERWSYTVTWAEGMIMRVITRADIDEARAAAERLAEERG